MFRELAWYSWHVGWAPGEDFPFFTEESDEGSRLLFWEVGVHADCFLWFHWVHLMGDRVAVNAEVARIPLTRFGLLTEKCFCLLP